MATRAGKTSQIHIYDHPWEVVYTAYNARWPTHPLIPVLQGSDVHSHGRLEGTDLIRTVRTVHIALDFPGWIKNRLGVETLDFLQTTTINPRTRWLRVSSRNLFLEERVVVSEVMIMQEHPDDPASKTFFSQSATLSLKGLGSIGKMVENLAMKSYAKNTAKGRETDTQVIHELLASGAPISSPLDELSTLSTVKVTEPDPGYPEFGKIDSFSAVLPALYASLF